MMACHFSFNLIDSIWVGRLIGPAALAAVSTSGFYVWVALSLGEMVEIGLIAVAARRHGEGDPERAARAAAAAVVYALLAGLVVSVAGELLAATMFRLMSVPPDVARLGHAYLSTWLLGGPLVFGFFAVEATFRAAGDTRTPFLMLAGSVCVSILLDPLLIMGLGPFPRLGVEGAALASVMVRGGGFLLGLVIALRRGLLRVSAPDWRTLPTIVRIGAPLSLAGVLLSVIYMWLTRFTSRFGTPALAALGVGHKMEGLGFIAISGFALAASALVGQNLGARQEGRAREAVRYSRSLSVTLYARSAGDRRRRAVSAGDRVRADRPELRAHPRGRARGRGLHLLAADCKHHPYGAANPARRLVVAGDRPAGHLARLECHGYFAGDRDGALLESRSVAYRQGLRP